MLRSRLAALAAPAIVVASALAAQPPAAEDPLAAAETAIAREDPESALRLLEPFLRRDPKNAPALLLRSSARCMTGDLAGCKSDLDQSLKLDPRQRQGWLNRSAIAIAEERYDDALAALREAERLDPAAADNAVNQGAVQLLRGDLTAATADFQRFLQRDPKSADGWYLVASNYAHAGYAALAVQHLEHAVALDERTRVRARTDANFAALASNKAFQQLLTTDPYVPPPGSLTVERVFQTRYVDGDSPIVVAILNTLQLSGARLDPRVEITPDWALLWSDFRIKVERHDDGTTTLRLSAPPGVFTPSSWQARTAAFFSEIDGQLLRLELAASRQHSDQP